MGSYDFNRLTCAELLYGASENSCLSSPSLFICFLKWDTTDADLLLRIVRGQMLLTLWPRRSENSSQHQCCLSSLFDGVVSVCELAAISFYLKSTWLLIQQPYVLEGLYQWFGPYICIYIYQLWNSVLIISNVLKWIAVCVFHLIHCISGWGSQAQKASFKGLFFWLRVIKYFLLQWK